MESKRKTLHKYNTRTAVYGGSYGSTPILTGNYTNLPLPSTGYVSVGTD
jgi:hypothetical protein